MACACTPALSRGTPVFCTRRGLRTGLVRRASRSARIRVRPPAMNLEDYKRQAAAAALEFVEPGMRLGLGTGSTAKHFVELLADRVRAGLDVAGGATPGA